MPPRARPFHIPPLTCTRTSYRRRQIFYAALFIYSSPAAVGGLFYLLTPPAYVKVFAPSVLCFCGGFDFALGETADMLRDSVRSFAADQDRAARRRDRPHQHLSARPVARSSARSACTASRSRRNSAAPAWAISNIASRWRKSSRARPRSACPMARIPIFASTRSAATARDEQKRRYLPKLISGEHVGALAMSEAGRRLRRRRRCARAPTKRATATSSTAPRCGSPTGRTPTRWWSMPRPIPKPARAASPRS